MAPGVNRRHTVGVTRREPTVLDELSRPLLKQGLDELGLHDPALEAALVRFLALLAQWNEVHNLTAVTAPEDMVTKHLMDSLAVWRYLPSRRILDLGTGAGLPGVPLALACPDRAFVLLDSRAKKLGFVRHVCRELRLANVDVAHARVEDYHPEVPFDAVIARAFAPLPRLAEHALPLLKPGGVLLAMTGRAAGLHDASLPAGFDSLKLIGLKVPHLAAARHLALLQRQS